jgi:hypothetical protein
VQVCGPRAVLAALLGLLAVLLPTRAFTQEKSAEPRAPAAVAPAVRIPVKVDPRVELMSILFRLAGNPEYGQGRVDRYTRDVEARFGKLRDHPAVRTARNLRRWRGVSYDAVMNMAVHVTDPPALEEAVPFEPRPASLESRWPVKGARRFLAEARDFAREAEFPAFFAAHREIYATATKRMQAVLDQHARLDWFDTFFGARPGARFQVVLGMLNGGSCYGAMLRRPDGSEDLYCILGVWATDEEGLPRFDASMLGTVVHEFCHSYCNPLVDAHVEELRAPGEALWPFVEEAMKAQAFAGGDAARRQQIAREHERGFAWTGELSDVLATYEHERKKYPKLDDFMPEVASFFARYAKAFAARMERAPKVVSMVPANGASDVDPALGEIKVTFDRPMRDRAWSVVRAGGEFPKIAGPVHYAEARTVLTIPVRLEPGTRYELWLNRGRYMAFQSEDGIALRPLRVTFRTADR